MEKRSQIINLLPKKMHTQESYLANIIDDTLNDAIEFISRQESNIDTVKKRLRQEYRIDELTDDEINLLMEYQIKKCLEYSPNARSIDPRKNVIFILDEVEKNADYFHNVLAIGKLLKFDTINDTISFAIKYSNCKIWNDLLECIKKNEIDESVISKLKTLNQVKAKVKGDISLQEIIQWDGDLSSLEFDTTTNPDEFTGHASPQKNFKIAFYKYNEEVIRITPEGDIYYSSVSGKGHPAVACEIYENEIDITDDMRKGPGFEIYTKAAQALNNITILGAGERPILYLPENLSDDQKKVLYKLLVNCNTESFNIAVIFIAKNGELKDPLCVNEYGDLAEKENVDAFIDLYLGRYSIEELNGYKEKDLHLEKKSPLAEKEEAYSHQLKLGALLEQEIANKGSSSLTINI